MTFYAINVKLVLIRRKLNGKINRETKFYFKSFKTTNCREWLSTIHFHLKKLEEKGYIKKGDNKNRTIEILVPNEYLEKNENIIDVPLLGKVTAGTPIEAIETPDEYFSLPANLVNSKNEVFTLKVSGESMINVGIYDGDILIVEKRNTARNMGS